MTCDTLVAALTATCDELRKDTWAVPLCYWNEKRIPVFLRS